MNNFFIQAQEAGKWMEEQMKNPTVPPGFRVAEKLDDMGTLVQIRMGTGRERTVNRKCKWPIRSFSAQCTEQRYVRYASQSVDEFVGSLVAHSLQERFDRL